MGCHTKAHDISPSVSPSEHDIDYKKSIQMIIHTKFTNTRNSRRNKKKKSFVKMGVGRRNYTGNQNVAMERVRDER
jgi:hypothetical protein